MSDQEFRTWAGTICEGLLPVPTTYPAVLAWDDGEEIVLAAMTEQDVTDLTEVRAMIDQQPRQLLAMATQVAWSGEPENPTTQAWLVTVVAPDREAGFFIRRHAEDDRWWTLTPDQVPWSALSTASSLRQVLAGEPFPPVKSVSDQRLLTRPAETPSPPVGPDGRL